MNYSDILKMFTTASSSAPTSEYPSASTGVIPGMAEGASTGTGEGSTYADPSGKAVAPPPTSTAQSFANFGNNLSAGIQQSQADAAHKKNMEIAINSYNAAQSPAQAFGKFGN